MPVRPLPSHIPDRHVNACGALVIQENRARRIERSEIVALAANQMSMRLMSESSSVRDKALWISTLVVMLSVDA